MMAETPVAADPPQTADNVNAADGNLQSGIDPQAVRQDLEQRLRDIQLPEAVDWWPPAPGWWVLAVAGIMLGIVLTTYLSRQMQNRRRTNPRRQRLDRIYAHWVETGQAETYYQQINQQLRLSGRAALGEAFPARLSSHAWVDWMERSAQFHYSDTTRHALAESCYQRHPLPPSADMHAEICAWSDQFAHARGAIAIKHTEITPTNTGVGHV